MTEKLTYEDRLRWKREFEANFHHRPAPKPEPPVKAKGRPKLTRKEKLRFALDKGAFAAERSTQDLLWRAGRGEAEVVRGKLNHRVWWVLLVAAKKIVEDGVPVFETPEEVKMAEDDLRRFPALFQPGNDCILPTVEFDDDEFRRILNKPYLKSEDIEAIVTDFLALVIKTPKNFEAIKIDGEKELVPIAGSIGSLGFVKYEGERVREHGRWKGRMVRRWKIYFNSPPGLAFYQNVVTHRFTLINNWRGFMALSGPAQTLFLSISWREDIPAILTFNQIVKIVGWERWDADNHARQVRGVEALLDGLKKSCWIGSWRRLRGEVYEITKTNYNRLSK